MCGIFGWQLRPETEFTTYQGTIFAITLGEEMQSRGSDSHGGMLWVPNADTPITIKALGKVVEHGSDGLLERASAARTALMHTRAATVGAVTINNSHPFEVGDVTGVHNGSVYNYKELNDKYNRKFDVDSTHIFAHLDDGLDMTELDMSGTIVFTKRSEDYERLYFARTDLSSFELARVYYPNATASGHHIMTVFASTMWAIRKACERLGLEYRLITVEPEMLYFIENGTPYDPQTQFPLRSMSRIVRTTTTTTTKSSDTGNFNRDLKKVSESDDAASSLIYDPPVLSNLRDLTGLIRQYFGVNRNAEVLCPKCGDWLSEHVWGYCLNDSCTNETVCLHGLALCSDCGCALVQNVHIPNALDDGSLWCNVCTQTCDVAAKAPSKQERRQKRKDAREIRHELRTRREGTDEDVEDQTIVERLLLEGKVVRVTTLDAEGAPPTACSHCSNDLALPLSKATGYCFDCRRKAGGNKTELSICPVCNSSQLIMDESILEKKCYKCRNATDVTDARETLSDYTDKRVSDYLDQQALDLTKGMEN